MSENKYGKAVNAAVKYRLQEYGLENIQQARWMAIGIAFDVIKIMQSLSVEPQAERRSDTRINKVARAAFKATEGLNPKGPTHF